jgi:hypothetical protein
MPDVTHPAEPTGATAATAATAADGAALLGTVIRLQVQTDRLKPGTAPWRRYDPAPLLAVPELALEPAGVRGVTADGRLVLDAHHPEHPRTRHRAGSAVSLMTTGGYAALRERYGAHLVIGSVGESLLLDGGDLTGADLSAGLDIETADGARLALDHVVPTTPCVEFCRFCVREEPSSSVSALARAALDDLRDGARGFLGVPRGTGRVRAGARVWLRDRSRSAAGR